MGTARLVTAVVSGFAAVLGAALPAVAQSTGDAAPTLAITGQDWSRFYPAEDGFKDTVTLDYTVADDTSASLDVTVEVRSRGSLVWTTTRRVDAGPGTVSWDGTGLIGEAPAGSYTMSLVATDESGRRSARQSRSVVLDRARLVSRTFRDEVSAQRSVVGTQVGRCATLREPSLRRWRGSLGYYSNTRCDRTGRPSHAATVNGVVVPEALDDPDVGRFYDSLVVKVDGGAARSRDRSRAQLQY